ncbi:putative signaling protein [Acaryochloris thomasi RCC1774]|uniref:Putative signaling protein n=1 Tax=Acaryochloris thomasi RCC1774 TaxID=1764569 RepID=A0A2W1K0B8_9CYAN|nr:EAL domain-containing protein [Acaryochloris thomasi]PZD74091.1 putative signaling protein [Acaryochloris thomasi RCC1774]
MPTGSIKLLVIDDDPVDIKLLSTYLSGHPQLRFELQAAHSLSEGLSCLKQDDVDVVLLDLFLQDGGEGLPTFRRLYDHCRDIPIVILTGLQDESLAVCALREGAQDYLTKGNFDCNLLGRTIRYAIERHHLHTQIESQNQALRRSDHELRNLIERNIDGILILDENGTIQFANAAAAKLLGQPASEMVQECFGVPLVPNHMVEVEIPGSPEKSKNAELRVVELTWEGKKAYLASLRDVTQQKESEVTLQQLAYSDSLTHLANRALFMERLRQTLARAHRHCDRPFMVMFIDLDHFKQVNDTLGHSAGDQLLVHVSHQLQHCIRPEDTLARLGGDEFAIILEDITEVGDAIRIAERILGQLSQPYTLQGHDCLISGSIGIVSSQNQLTKTAYPDIESLLRDADIAMYRAKQEGKARYAVFDHRAQAKAMLEFELEAELRRAVAQQELCLFYQPIVRLKTGKICGFEALVRWKHPRRGLLVPGEFMPVAERTDLIAEIDTWVLQSACQQFQWWNTQGLSQQLGTVSVNVSGRRLAQKSFIEQTQQALHRSGLSPHHLQLEITEDIILTNTQTVVSSLEHLRALGCKLSIDDFGTGYSSLSRLHSFPLDTLKVDRSFLLQAARQQNHWSIVQAIINLSTDLGLSVVAEGIETNEQCDRLRQLSCSKGQGYLFSRPVTQEKATQLLRANQSYLEPVVCPTTALQYA